jgi:hypothetical protein
MHSTPNEIAMKTELPPPLMEMRANLVELTGPSEGALPKKRHLRNSGGRRKPLKLNKVLICHLSILFLTRPAPAADHSEPRGNFLPHKTKTVV